MRTSDGHGMLPLKRTEEDEEDESNEANQEVPEPPRNTGCSR